MNHVLGICPACAPESFPILTVLAKKPSMCPQLGSMGVDHFGCGAKLTRPFDNCDGGTEKRSRGFRHSSLRCKGVTATYNAFPEAARQRNSVNFLGGIGLGYSVAGEVAPLEVRWRRSCYRCSLVGRSGTGRLQPRAARNPPRLALSNNVRPSLRGWGSARGRSARPPRRPCLLLLGSGTYSRSWPGPTPKARHRAVEGFPVHPPSLAIFRGNPVDRGGG
jgi:hypothetical protein